MTTLTVALLQLAPPGPELSVNLALGEAACRRAGAMGADIALFPEMWSNGYSCSVPDGFARGDRYRHPSLWDEASAAPRPSSPASVSWPPNWRWPSRSPIWRAGTERRVTPCPSSTGTAVWS
ncbi:hypothetical protein SSPO_009270 [Streptomyces antimycoticus]|uniref:CN hydrolase domain-containing protein n=1 Tax=Streptomyces antimycoticus TaxID=68175 RepID=A0A499UM40_9ACTN|nr:hypothetical protein SSPO_009270 [Streptomyces antimycoticus]